MSEPAPEEAPTAHGDSVVVEITAFLANRLVLEMLAGIAFRRKGGTWDSIPKSLLEGRA
jgi:hypothetical protein